MPCAVCSHLELAAINELITSGASNGAISTEYAIPIPALVSHKAICLSVSTESIPPRLASPSYQSQADTVLRGITRAQSQLLEIIAECRTTGNQKLAVQALRGLAGSLSGQIASLVKLSEQEKNDLDALKERYRRMSANEIADQLEDTARRLRSKK